jgi:hypothetical protein
VGSERGQQGQIPVSLSNTRELSDEDGCYPVLEPTKGSIGALAQQPIESREAAPELTAIAVRAASARRSCWCASAGVPSVGAVEPVHVATRTEAATPELAAPSVKQRLARDPPSV